MFTITNATRARLRDLIPLLVLPVVLLVCCALWLVMGNGSYHEARSANGVWDLRWYDFESESVRVVGDVEYIPHQLLTPEEFESRADEILLGDPSTLTYATSRVTLLLPGGLFTLAGTSTDYADRLFINGRWVMDVGVPGDSFESMVPDTAAISFTSQPEDGKIQIVQQVSNFVHRNGGRHDDFRVGRPDMLRESYGSAVTNIVMGCFLALFLVHLALFLLLSSYRANLFFSLFCLTWFFRTGVTGHKVLGELLPALSWLIKFKIEYITLPLTGLFILLMLPGLFPGVLPRMFQRITVTACVALVIFFLVAGSMAMSFGMIVCYAVLGAAMLFVVGCFAVRMRHPKLDQSVSMMGVMLLFYAGIRDMFYYSDILLFPAMDINLSEVAMLAFVFFQMVAVFLGTVRALDEAQDAEHRLRAENAALEHLARMKSDLIATMSHEARTPLAVLSTYAELIARGLRKKGVDEQTARDLDRITDETQRIADLMERVQSMAKSSGSERVRIEEVIASTARLYEPIFKRKGIELALSIEAELPPIFGNAAELTQLMFNLLTNAKSHTDTGSVLIAVRHVPGGVETSVTDTGSGIRPEFVPHVFERYRSDGEGGTGLGLALCREIVEGHGGTIRVESEPGLGTSIIFELPFAMEPLLQ